MDYGNLFSRAWKLIWENKALIFVGMLAVLSGVGGGSQGISMGLNQTQYQMPTQFDLDFRQPWQDIGHRGFVIAAVSIVVLVALVMWVVGTIARGGLISGAEGAGRGEDVRFQVAFQAGLEKGWRLIGIGLIPAVPVVLLMLSAIISAGLFPATWLTANPGEGIDLLNTGVIAPLLLIALLALGLYLLRALANRACMLEDLGVGASYRRGAQVLAQNPGTAVMLYLAQIALSLMMGFILLVPLALSALCCLLWPLLWFIQGGFTAFYSTLWTLAWGQWTDNLPG